MAGLPPGDPQLVSMIVSHLKTQGLFDQFRRDCLADVDTKPAYLNLKQRVDNFVSNHLSNHTWSPHLNKNQLRNNIRQLVLQSGMLEQGVDRIVAQVVDPKINHIFRPQVERVVREFLSPGSCSEEPPAPLPSTESKPDSSTVEQVPSSAPATTSASDAMSILDTITTLNQEASVRASSGTDKGRKGQTSEEAMLVEEGVQDMNLVEEEDGPHDGRTTEEPEELVSEVQTLEVKTEDTQEQMDLGKEGSVEEVKMEEEEPEAQELSEEDKDKASAKTSGKPAEEKQDEDQLKFTSQDKQKARERIKEEYFLEDSDLEGLSDITVSSVHTSDLSSFEGESEDEQLLSDSSEEGELPPDDQGERVEKKHGSGDAGEEDRKPRRKAYVHKPFLYSRYYSDSDDEITVEERRRSVAKDKEDRLLKRQQNRERMEEKRKQKAVQPKEQDDKKPKVEDSSAGQEHPKAKEARKERKVLEKKMALNRKRKLDSRNEADILSKKKGDSEGFKKSEVKAISSKALQPKLARNLSELASCDERHRRMSGSVSEDSSDAKKLSDKGRTHSFILELEQGSQEALKQRSVGKFDRLSRKELHSKERKEKERSLSDERTKLKQKPERKFEHQADESQQAEGAAFKMSSEEKGERKLKVKGEKKTAGTTREGKPSVSEVAADESPKDAAVKKAKAPSVEAVRAEKEKSREKEKEKDKSKEKEKVKGEKTSAKSDFKQVLRPDSTGSSEDRSDVDPGSDGSKKKDKQSKEILKRPRSHTEDRPGDKPKPKTEGKDGEKEKNKAEQDGQKSSDKDPKKVKPTDKIRIMEKPKSKSREETKTQLLSKMDNKVQSSDVKSTGGASVSKPEATKEKKKDGNVKEQRKVSEESLPEKTDIKSAKKKPERKDKVQEKRDDSQEEKRTSREDKTDKSQSVETEEQQQQIHSLLQDTSTDSDPVTAAAAASFSDDTCDALSDITPEPPESETESRLSEIPAVPAEADALLTLMDVCTSEGARLPPDSAGDDVTPEMTAQEADRKMKEAALTLLSMDSAVSSILICQDSREEAELRQAAPQPMEAAAAEQDEQTAEFTAVDLSPTVSQQTVELVPENTNTADLSENLEKETDLVSVELSKCSPPKEDDTTSNEHQAPLSEDEARGVEIPPETQADEEVAAAAAGDESADAAACEPEEIGGAAVSDVSDASERAAEMSEQDQTEPDVPDTTTNLETKESVVEDEQAKMDVDNSEAESKEMEEEASENVDPQTVEHGVAEKPEEVGESGPDIQSELVKQISGVSSTDNQEDEKGSDVSDKEEKTEGRGRCKRKLPGLKAVKESGDESDEKERKEKPSAEETDVEKVVEIKKPRRGRPPKTTEGIVKDQPHKPEKMQASPIPGGGHPGAAARGVTAGSPPVSQEEVKQEVKEEAEKKPDDVEAGAPKDDPGTTPKKPGRRGRPPKAAAAQKQNENKDEGRDKTLSRKPAEREDMKKSDEESGPQKTGQQDSDVNLPSSAPHVTAAAGSSDSTDMRQPAVERRRSEEMEASVGEVQTGEEEVKEDDSQQKESERQAEKDSASPPESQEEVKEEAEKKPDDVEAEAPKEDPETTPKKPGRRGRPPKAAATEEQDKKDKKADDKESEQNDEQEEEDDGEEGKGTATRATTRSASRMEAERNKPSKPSTRASRQNGKEETAAGTRGNRGQAAATAVVVKGGRKPEASPPAVRTRGGQKSEEPPSKRAKR